MLLRRVIPCLDVKDGRVVKGVRFVGLTDEGDPPELARRYAEAGVRFIQATHSYKWDQHGNLRADHAKNAREVDLPIAGLIRDTTALVYLESPGSLTFEVQDVPAIVAAAMIISVCLP